MKIRNQSGAIAYAFKRQGKMIPISGVCKEFPEGETVEVPPGEVDKVLRMVRRAEDRVKANPAKNGKPLFVVVEMTDAEKKKALASKVDVEDAKRDHASEAEDRRKELADLDAEIAKRKAELDAKPGAAKPANPPAFVPPNEPNASKK